MSIATPTSKQPDRSAPVPGDSVMLARDLEGLAALPLDQLRVQFRNRTGRIAPIRLSRALLLRVLAYRLQAERFGDLRPETRRLFKRAAAGASSAASPADDRSALARAEARMPPRSGTVLVREWQGRMEHVMVMPDGFTWNGAIFPSLSAVATTMTGTKWNGCRFFGLDQEGRKPGRRPKGLTAEMRKETHRADVPAPTAAMGGQP